MSHLPFINLISILHLVAIALWGGVVSAESVIELYPYRKPDMHSHAVRAHYWIDLLVELPLIVVVVASGILLVTLAWPITWTHAAKIGCALVAVSANLVCVALVLKRGKALASGAAESELWLATRRIVMCAVVGLPFAAVAAGLGFWLAYHRLLGMVVG